MASKRHLAASEAQATPAISAATTKSSRKASPGTLKEKEFKKDKSYCTVTCRLQTICRDPLLRDDIQQTTHALKQIQMEAWHLVNLHSLRRLENGLTLPGYCKPTFYDHCCSGVATTDETHLTATKDPDLWESIQIYQDHRSRSGLEQVVNLPGYPRLKQELREQMVVNAGVMISHRFAARFRLYIRIVFGGLGSRLTKKEKKAKKKLVKDVMDACYSDKDTNLTEALQMRDVLTSDGVEWSEQWIPSACHVRQNGLVFYVQLIWESQCVVEERLGEAPIAKGLHMFSLFPVATTYSRNHIPINASTLHGFYRRIEALEDDYRWDVPGVELTETAFKANRWTVMRNAFNVASFETRRAECPLSKTAFNELAVKAKYEYASHLFANQVTTDGYSASILLFRPRSESDTCAVKKFSEPYESQGLVVPVGYMPNVVIGLDSGMRALCTAVREDLRTDEERQWRPQTHSPRRRRRRRRSRSRQRKKNRKRKSDRPRWIRRVKAPKRQNDREIVRISTREYYHLAGFNRFRAWEKGVRTRNPKYQKVIAEMLSFKTASFAKYLERLKFFWRSLQYLLQFCANHPFLKWAFFRKCMARTAVDAIAARIVPTVGEKTCVVYGDWRRSDGVKCHARGPIKGLKQALRKRATVVSVDEFRTSKLCSQCHRPLSSVHYSVDTMLPKRKKRMGQVLVRNRAEVQFELRKSFQVRRCDHAGCDARFWDRDVNAAINMLELLESEALGLGRMAPFRRTKTNQN